VTSRSPQGSARRQELLERAYEHVLGHGLAGVSLRPLAAAVGSSPRVLLFLFGSKDGLVRELIARARAEEVALLAELPVRDEGELAQAGREIWGWLCAEEHRGLLRLWVESYAQSLIDPEGPWADFAHDTVRDWLTLLARTQSPRQRSSAAGRARATLVLAVLRGAMLDLLATGELERTTAAVEQALAQLG
jgi:AcrR family transcriptional regulator